MLLVKISGTISIKSTQTYLNKTTLNVLNVSKRSRCFLSFYFLLYYLGLSTFSLLMFKKLVSTENFSITFLENHTKNLNVSNRRSNVYLLSAGQCCQPTFTFRVKFFKACSTTTNLTMFEQDTGKDR